MENKVKYRGRLIITHELLKQSLGLPEDIEIEQVYVTEKDITGRRLSMNLVSDNKTNFTPMESCEGATLIGVDYER